LTVPGLHASFDREPQFSALRDCLRACLIGEAPRGLEPSEVFGRTYHLEEGSGCGRLRNGDGSALAIEDGAMRGRVRLVRSGSGKPLLRGWSSDSDGRRPAGTIVAFVDGRYAGYSTCSAPTESLARRLEAPGLRHAGFRLRLRPSANGAHAPPGPRVFALTGDGRASELPVQSG
jgi:hypothetical protein